LDETKPATNMDPSFRWDDDTEEWILLQIEGYM